MITADAGASWSRVEFPLLYHDWGAFTSCTILDENTAIIVGHNGLIIKTVDKGQLWEYIPLQIAGDEDITGIDFINDQIGFLSAHGPGGEGSGKYFFKSNDGGETWIEADSELTDMFWSNGLSLEFIDENIGFAYEGQNIYKTMDGGLTWTVIENPSDGGQIFKVSVADNGMVVMSMTDVLENYYLSDNLGDSWQVMGSLAPPDIFNTISPAFDLVGNKIHTVKNLGLPTGSYIIFDIISSAIEDTPLVATNMPYQTDVCVVNDDTVIITAIREYWSVYPGRKIIRTANGGVLWEDIDSFWMPNTGTLSLQTQQNGPDIFTAGTTNVTSPDTDFTLLVSVDDGTTWQSKAVHNDSGGKLLKAAGNYISYITESQSEIMLYESDDLGETWESSEISTSIPDMWVTINRIDQIGDEALKIGKDNLFAISTDKGQTWEALSMPQVDNVEFLEAYIETIDEIYAWGIYQNWSEEYDYYLYRSTDMGESWETIVVIPDNNGADMDGPAITTVFGQDYAVVSTGGNTYFKVDLINNTYVVLDFNHPYDEFSFVYEGELTILDDNLWTLKKYEQLFISYNEGSIWSMVNCWVCGQTAYNDEADDLISFSEELGIERIQHYTPASLTIIGNTISEVNIEETYYVPNHSLANVEWILESGGTIMENPDDEKDYIKIEWTVAGEHILKARRVNDFGASSYYELAITVEEPTSGVEELLPSTISVSPNPFSDLLNIEFQNLHSEKSVVTILSLTGQVIYKETVEGKLFSIKPPSLPNGVYFLVLENGNNKSTRKIIKH